jgi:ABC-2 type transport system permease protein
MNKHFAGDTAVLLGRSLGHITRSPDTISTTAIMPIRAARKRRAAGTLI